AVRRYPWVCGAILGGVLAALGISRAQESRKPPDPDKKPVPSSYAPVVITEPFESIRKRMEEDKPKIMKRQMDLLAERYDLADKPAEGVKMTRGKPVQEGVRVKLPAGTTWEKLAALSPEQVRQQDLWPAGFYPLPHPNHAEGGMLFPKFHIEEVKKQE